MLVVVSNLLVTCTNFEPLRGRLFRKRFKLLDIKSALRGTEGKPKTFASERTVQYENAFLSNIYFLSSTNAKSLFSPMSSTIYVVISKSEES